ncbi:LysR family transcriptional regulator [Stappia sp.]|uniref:LysR family transcriptional regulator n=1 Tax=Stappia sp. TaxID=1870903 RepID=UPI003A9A098D
MDRFEAMSLLLAVIEHGSLSAAGRALRVPVTTISRKLSELETLLGTQLLIRTTRKLTLTDAGVSYIAAARRILEQVEEAEREAAGEFVAPKGELVVTAPILFGQLHVLPTVTRFLSLFPEIDIRLVLSDRTIHLLDDHVDMAVRVGALSDSAMIATRVGALRSVICASPAFLAAHGVPRRPEDLTGMPGVAFEGPSLHWSFHASSAGAATEIALRRRLSVTTAQAAVNATEAGVGFARLFYYQVAESVEAGRLAIVLAEFEPPPSPVSLVHVPRGQMPLKMRHFLDFAAPRLRAEIAALAPAPR